MTLSIFDGIKGMGKVKVKKLWSEFESLDRIKKASVQEIRKALKVSEDIAKEIIKMSNK